ncbi:protein kinase [Saccharopolyspora indica]|uniref:protein kinase domain-containing protein n=1 Tax=Saccharopolyspora indica TaxID=1229659 RepID=UPI0022EB5F8F|nr:protein kinase [Saccharopolyspora indica]MDA3645221.1 protein kinase [Saccharopolyspora indica]
MPHLADTAPERRLIGARYRLEGTIGHGAMGHVWAGTDELLHRPVAVKELRLSPGLAEEHAAEMRERALREARAMAALNHPNTVLLYDVAREDEQPFVVMELVHGLSLAQLLNKHRSLPPAKLAVLADGVAAALQAAHQMGIVHRDVKPGNVLLGADRQVKLADFGMSRSTGESTLTRSGVLVGTPAYLAPEIAIGGELGANADLWSFGAMLFAAAEGRLPYESSGDPLITISSIVHGPVPPHRQTGPIGEVISGLMIKDPARRMPLMEVRQRVHDLARQAGEHPFEEYLRDIEPPRPITPSATPSEQATAPAPAAKRSSTRTTIVLGATAVLAIGAATGGFLLGRAGGPELTSVPGKATTYSPAPMIRVNAFGTVEAEHGYLGERDKAKLDSDRDAGEPVGFVGPMLHGSSITFQDVQFGDRTATEVSLRLRTVVDKDLDATRIKLRLDGPYGEEIAKIPVALDRGPEWRVVPVKLTRPVDGQHTVHLSVIADKPIPYVEVDWVRFHR